MSSRPLLLSHHPTSSITTTDSTTDTDTEDPNPTTIIPPTLPTIIRKRHVGMDLFRGLIVMIMALDHTTHSFVASRDRYEGSEAWQGVFSTYNNSWRVFIERAVSHICAPGFFLTMGIGMTLFSISRTEHLHWSPFRLLQHFCVRGIVLCLVQPVIGLGAALPILVDVGIRGREWPMPAYGPGDEGKLVARSMIQWIVITTTLGLTMISMSWFFFPLHRMDLKFPHTRGFAAFAVSLVIFIMFQAIANVVIVHAQHGNPREIRDTFPGEVHTATTFSQLILRVLFFPGCIIKDYILWDYPLIQWSSMAVLGMGFGFIIKKNSDIILHRTLRVMAVMFLFFFIVFRIWGGPVGNYRGKSRGDNFARDSIMFWAVTKYPPDLVFSLLTLGLDFALLSLLSHSMFEQLVQEEEDQILEQPLYTKIARRICSLQGFRNVLLVFGRVPFFFFVIHIWVIALFEALLRLPDPPSGRFRLEIVLIWWILVLLAMFPLCVRFHTFKESTGIESWWRVF